MFGYQRHHLVPLALATSLGLMALGASTAQAHTHPSPIERAAPAVVFIEARAHVEVTLIEHNKLPDKQGVHVHVFEDTSDPVLGTASGFFVEPNGTVVTTGALLRQDLDRGEVWAVNEAFATHYPKQARLPADRFARQHIGPGTDRVEQRLQACYPPHVSLKDAGGCVIRTQLKFIVHPYVTSQANDGNLSAEALPQSTKDVGLLDVQTNGVPTVRLAPPLPTDYAMDVLGFVGIPGPVSTVPDPKNTNPHGQHDIVQHFDPKGGPLLKYKGLEPAEAAGSAMLKQQLGTGIEGGPVVAAGKDATSGGQVIGLIPGPAPAGQPVPTLIGATTILNVLKSAGVENRSSLTDTQFDAAMHRFKNKEYAASVPYLKKTLEQFRGHALAAANLAIANAQVKKGAGSPRSTTVTTTTTGGGSGSAGSSRVPPLLIALVAAALATLLAVGIALRQRRRERDGDKDVRPSPASAVPARAPGTGSLKPGPGPARGAAAPSGGPAGGPGAAPRTAGAAGAAVSRVRERSDLLHQTSSTTASPATQPSRNRPTPDRGSTDQPSTLQRSANNNPSAAHQPTAGAAAAATAPAAAATRFCTSCGGQLAAGHRFCGRCGASAGI